jgi:hypothetical protein
VDELRTTVQEEDFQVSTKGVYNVQMGWERGKRGRGVAKKGHKGVRVQMPCLYMC